MGRERSASEETDDARVIERSLTAPDAFATIFERHFTAVYGYLARRSGRAQAEDLVAATFTVAFERRERFRPEATSARPWLLGIATNLLRNQWRAERRGFDLVTRLRHGLGASAHEPAETGGVLAGLLARLDADQRDVLLLYAWEELSYEEISAALAIPIGTVRSRLARARAHLREGLEGEGFGQLGTREASG